VTEILFWPGIGRKPGELEHLFSLLGTRAFSVSRAEALYDIGPPPPDPASTVYRRLMAAPHSPPWWIGLSLGAAVAHVVAATIPASWRPRRLTLINSFADRELLAHTRDIGLEGQWLLRPIDFAPAAEVRIDIVMSVNDERIPPEHSVRLAAALGPDTRIIRLTADHAISDAQVQRQLARELLEHPNGRD
jgi:pimeloyl-ACP methyl ester carboxylesterase